MIDLKILTWNIHKGIGGLDRKYSLERVAQVIRETDADLALLQEVADGWPPAGGDLQAQCLTSMTQLPHMAFAPEHRFRQGGYGNAILSRYPIVESFRVDLKIGWRKQRSALQALLHLPGAGRRHLVATCAHLGLAETERRKQLRQLFQTEQFMQKGEPAIVAGDFNDVFGGLEKRFFSDKGFTRAVPRTRSFPAFAPFFSLDGIFVRGLTPIDGAAVRTPLTQEASDHLPLLASVRLDEA